MSVEDHYGPVKITVTCPETGQVLNEKVISNDYLIITNGTRYVKSYQIWGNTHQVNIALRKLGSQKGGDA